jgi:hypothetical protein
MDIMGFEAHHLAWWRIFSLVVASSKRLSNKQIDDKTQEETQPNQ